MLKQAIRIGLLLTGLFISLPTLAQEVTPPGQTLNAVLSRRELYCGVNQDAFGFGYLDPNTGEVSGFDVDFCRAVASAVLGDATLVNLLIYPQAADAEQALRQGEIDLLMHNVTWTLTDDAQGLVFGPPNFYGGQTIMVRGDSPANDWPDLDGATICVVAGSTAESHIVPYMRGRGLRGNIQSLTTLEDGQNALDDGRCDALSGDIAQLTAIRQRSGGQQTYRVWQNSQQIYTHEPYAPVMRAGDDQWATIVGWTVLGLIQAEQLGVTSESVDTILRRSPSANGQASETDADYIQRVGPEIATLFDPQLGIGNLIGLQPNFMFSVIRQVGNYGEIYNRYLGANGELPIDRGLNQLWKNGGLLYAPEWR